MGKNTVEEIKADLSAKGVLLGLSVVLVLVLHVGLM